MMQWCHANKDLSTASQESWPVLLLQGWVQGHHVLRVQRPFPIPGMKGGWVWICIQRLNFKCRCVDCEKFLKLISNFRAQSIYHLCRRRLRGLDWQIYRSWIIFWLTHTPHVEAQICTARNSLNRAPNLGMQHMSYSHSRFASFLSRICTAEVRSCNLCTRTRCCPHDNMSEASSLHLWRRTSRVQWALHGLTSSYIKTTGIRRHSSTQPQANALCEHLDQALQTGLLRLSR